ncbi:MAG: DUF4157 domain-containing protein [Coleofasciculus sp. D1-CHI-01]|uniref:eCIS core domain-containing protein n=1 Tax=Coleofasciculus sp. D1-CHI-01 TaxID=3068482 RepID=UPI0032FDD55F
MYKPPQKKNSSWTPSTVQKKGKSPSKLGHFSIQPKSNPSSTSSQEIGEYSRTSMDRLAANVMRSLQTREQEIAEESIQPKFESPWAPTFEPPPPLPESPASKLKGAFAPVSKNPIQRQCTECAKEEEEQKGEERKDLDEIGIQTKLTVGAPGDSYEQEADRVASQVMSMSAPADSSASVQRQLDTNHPHHLHQIWQRAQSIKPVVQRQVDPRVQMGQMIQRAHQIDGNQASGDLESRLNASKGGGSPLSENVRGFMEPRFGADFSGVRVHTGGEAVQMNQELGAQAFTHGSDVYFGQGKEPGNNELTAHELTHVVQQKSDIRRNSVIQRSPDPLSLSQSVNPASLSDTEIEREIYLIRSWLTQNQESSSDADLLSSSLNALESELSARGSSQQAETSQSSSRHSQSSAAFSTPSQSVASSTVEPRSLRESVDPAVMSQAELETEIQAIRSWLLSHPPSHPEYELLSQSLSTLEHTVSTDGNVQYLPEGDRQTFLPIDGAEIYILEVDNQGNPVAGLGAAQSGLESTVLDSALTGLRPGATTGGAQSLSYLLAPPIRSRLDPLLPLMSRTGDISSPLGRQGSHFLLERYAGRGSQLLDELVPRYHGREGLALQQLEYIYRPGMHLSPSQAELLPWLAQHRLRTRELESIPQLLARAESGGFSSLSAAEQQILHSAMTAHAESGQVAGSPFMSATRRANLSGMQGTGTNPTFLRSRQYVVRIRVPASAVADANALIPRGQTHRLAHELEMLVATDARGSIQSVRPNPTSSIGRASPWIRRGGRVLLVAGLAYSGYRISSATTEERPRVIGEEVGGHAGGWGGAALAAGGCIAFGIASGGLGLLACGVLGGLAGGFVGSAVGGEIGEATGR